MWPATVTKNEIDGQDVDSSSGKACLNCSEINASTPSGENVEASDILASGFGQTSAAAARTADMAFYERHTQALFHLLQPIPCPMVLHLHALGSGVDGTGRLDGFEQLHAPQAENNPTISLNPQIRVRSDRRGHRCPWKRGEQSKTDVTTRSRQRPANVKPSH